MSPGAKRTTEVTAATAVTANDLFVVSNTTLTQSATLDVVGDSLNIVSNVAFAANTVNIANGQLAVDSINITDSYTPNAETDSAPQGKVWYDSNNIYIATSNNLIRRVSLLDF